MRPIPSLPVWLLVAALAATGAELKLEAWSRCAPIELAHAPAKGIVEFELTPEVYDIARPDLADLRVIADPATEVAHVVRVPTGSSRSVRLQVKLYNRTYVEGKHSSVTVDFAEKVLKHRIEVDTPGTNFRRKLLVEGSDDGLAWQTVRDDALLFRIRNDQHGDYHKNAVELPANDQRYLRVTVYNGQDDPPRVEPLDVRAWRVERKPARTAPVPIAASKATEKESTTEIALDLGWRRLPLHKLTLRFADANFFRRISLSGRDQEVRTRDTGGLLSRKKDYDEPWLHVASGAIYQYASGRGGERSLTIDLRRAPYRYLLVRVHNADDPPLRFEKGEATRLVHLVAFQPQAGKRCRLYFGNPRAARPSYDLSHYVGRLRSEGVAQATLGEAGEPSPRPRPRREQAPSPLHKLLIWVLLLVALAVLAVLVYRQAKAARPPAV